MGGRRLEEAVLHEALGDFGISMPQGDGGPRRRGVEHRRPQVWLIRIGFGFGAEFFQTEGVGQSAGGVDGDDQGA
jgi:hypothetical protein